MEPLPDDPFTPTPDARREATPLKGRGTATRLAHRFAAEQRQAEDDGWGGDDGVPTGEGDGLQGGVEHAAPEQTQPAAPRVLMLQPEVSPPPTQVVDEHARSILSRNDSPDIPFTWSVNPYRGCEHGCIYCYARPTHSYLNLSPGLDFETKLVAKVNAAELLRRELAKPSYEPSPINIGSATDCYQPIERDLRLTRGVIEVLEDCRHPYTLVTKSSGVERDIDLLARAAARRQAYVMISVTTLDPGLARRLEPRAAAPHRRLQTVRRLSEAGIPVGVNVAPVIPFLNEPEIERIIEAAAQAGARSIHYTIVRLPWEVSPLFEEWLAHHVPERAARVMARIREMRGGQNYDARFGQRMKGQGVWAELVRQRVDKARQRHGVTGTGPMLDMGPFVRPQVATVARGRGRPEDGACPGSGPQGELF